MFEGLHTALVTPFRDGAVDEPALRELVERQVEAGVDGIVPCGSTGEAATLSHAEHRRVVEVCVEAARGRVQVLAGTGSNSTRESIELTRHARDAGADCDHIPDTTPGVGYMMIDGTAQPVRVRAFHVADHDIATLAARFRPPRAATRTNQSNSGRTDTARGQR